MALPSFLVALVSYLLGSVPSGYLAGRIAGVDIRKRGSGNIGATNVTRELGKLYGYPVFLADFGKGLASVAIAKLVSHQFGLTSLHEALQILAAIFCVVGNTLPIWLGFKGGKGVATSAGALFGLSPLAALVALIVWVVTFELTRYVSLASVVAAVALPLTVFILTRLKPANGFLLFYFSVCLAAIVVLRHRSNLLRLIRGTEPRFNRE